MAGPELIERVQEQHPLDARVSTTLLVASIALSAMRLLGSDLDFLIPNPNTWPQSFWTLFTTCMLHGSWVHLLFNVFWLLRFGTAAEGLIGSVGMGFFVVFAGLGSGALQWAFDGAYVGLSGIVYGLFGLLWALGRWHPRGRGLMDPQTTGLLVVWFFLCILLDRSGTLRVANWAHGTGAALGVILGWSLSRSPDRRGWRWFAFPLASMGCLLVPLVLTPDAVTASHAERLFSEGTVAIQKGEEARDRGQHEAAINLFSEAEATLRASLAVRPFPNTYWNLSIALVQQGNFEEGHAMRAKAIDLDPSLDKQQ